MSEGGGFTSGSLWLFGATTVGNLCNFLYHLYMVRHLPTDQYAMLTSLIAMMTILAVPASTVQTTTSHRVAHLSARHHWSDLRLDLRRRFLMVSLLGMLWLMVAAVAHRALMAYLRFPDVPAVILTWGAVMSFSFILPVVWGSLQGLQAFEHLGANMMLSALLKLLLGFLLVHIGWAVLGAMQGLLVAVVVALGVGIGQLRHDLNQRHPHVRQAASWWGKITTLVIDGVNECWLIVKNPKDISRYAAVVAISVTAYTSLTNSDVVLAKHYLDPTTAGYYAMAAMVSRIVLFLPMAFSMVLFPKVAQATALERDARPLLRRVAFSTGLLSGLACAVCGFFPIPVMRILTGGVYPQIIPSIRFLATAMACLALANLYLLYLLAARQLRATLPFVASAVGHVTGIMVWHGTLEQVAGVTLTVAALLGSYSVAKIAGFSWTR